MPALSLPTIPSEELVEPHHQEDTEEKINRVANHLFTKFNFDPEDLWIIHGKRYDLTEFAKHHPGGEYILMVGKGRDCTELFESLHAVSSKPVHKMLEKYEVKEPVNNPSGLPENVCEDLFVWDENGFYSTLKKRVKEHFNGASHKATWLGWTKLAAMLGLYFYCWTMAFTTGTFWWSILSGALAGMIGFNLMHDSSHNALSSKPLINYLGSLWASWMYWNNWKWIQHHCYGHHSYTGIHMLDPDLANVGFAIRKHVRTPIGSNKKYQKYYSALLYLLLPNQHTGQVILYQLADKLKFFKNRLFGVPIRRGPEYLERDNLIVMTVSAIWHIVVPLFFISPLNVLTILFLHHTLMGISYYLNVAPNHDTIDLKSPEVAPNPLVKIDWGENQIRTTSNHSTKSTLSNILITQLWGGMNYQVEVCLFSFFKSSLFFSFFSMTSHTITSPKKHHLFPTVYHEHYPEISKIVAKTAKV